MLVLVPMAGNQEKTQEKKSCSEMAQDVYKRQMADIADRLDGIHKRHVGDNHALASAGRAGAFGIEGKQGIADAVCFGKQLPDRIGDIQVGGRCGAPVSYTHLPWISG